MTSPTKPITPLCQRMIDDMRMRKLSPKTQASYIFRAHGSAWRDAQHNHLSLGQLKVMSAIEQCRTATLGGNVRCPASAHQDIAYNSCRNRHCPKCQCSAAKRWLEARQADLLPVEYYHVVFTLRKNQDRYYKVNLPTCFAENCRITAKSARDLANPPVPVQVACSTVAQLMRLETIDLGGSHVRSR
jgi:hypothetical protein